VQDRGNGRERQDTRGEQGFSKERIEQRAFAAFKLAHHSQAKGTVSQAIAQISEPVSVA